MDNMDSQKTIKFKQNKNKKKTNKQKKRAPKNKAVIISDLQETKVDALNTTTRLPALIMIDTSQSMKGCEDSIRDAVMSVYREINNNRVAKNATEIGVVTFSNIINVIVNLQEVYNQKNIEKKLKIDINSMTLMGLALQQGLAMLHDRHQEYIKNAIRCYAPVLFVISDGNSFCSDLTLQVAEENAMREAKDTIKDLVRKNELVVIFFEIGQDINHKNAIEITGCEDDRRVIHLSYSSDAARNEVISEVFRLTSSMMINLSDSSGNRMRIDNIIKEIKKKHGN